MSNYLQTLLEETSTVDAVAAEDERLLDEQDMIMEALDDAHLAVVFDDELEGYQFYNQDHLNGMSDTDIGNFHPDGATARINNQGSGSATVISLLGEGVGSSYDEPIDNDIDPDDFVEETYDSTDLTSYFTGE